MAEVKIDRKARASEDREAEAREPYEYTPPSALPDPHPEEGYEFRWIRAELLNEPDRRNVQTRFREGWQPVPASEQEDLRMFVIQEEGSPFDGCIEVGGMLLCKAPTEMMVARQKYFDRQAANNMQAVDESMFREEQPGTHKMGFARPERSSEVEFGQRRPQPD